MPTDHSAKIKNKTYLYIVYDLLEGGFHKDLCFQKDMLDFILGKPYIPNKDNISFKEFCENYEKYCLKL